MESQRYAGGGLALWGSLTKGSRPKDFGLESYGGNIWRAEMICGEYYCLAHFSCAAFELALLSQLIKLAYRRCSILSSSTQDK